MEVKRVTQLERSTPEKRVKAASFSLVNNRDHASLESDSTWSDVGQGSESTKAESTPRPRM